MRRTASKYDANTKTHSASTNTAIPAWYGRKRPPYESTNAMKMALLDRAAHTFSERRTKRGFRRERRVEHRHREGTRQGHDSMDVHDDPRHGSALLGIVLLVAGIGNAVGAARSPSGSASDYPAFLGRPGVQPSQTTRVSSATAAPAIVAV